MRTVLVLFVSLFLLSVATPVLAQNVKAPYSAQFCWNGKEDDNVTPVTIAVSVIITVDGVDKPAVPLPASTSTAGCPAGSNLYKVSGYSSAKGPHSAVATLSTADGESVPSSPFAFTVVGKPPAAPTNLSVVQ
jgi:hypothetical protein